MHAVHIHTFRHNAHTYQTKTKKRNKGSMLGRGVLIPPSPAPGVPTWPLVTGAHGVAGLAQVAWVAVPPQIAVVSASDAHQAA